MGTATLRPLRAKRSNLPGGQPPSRNPCPTTRARLCARVSFVALILIAVVDASTGAEAHSSARALDGAKMAGWDIVVDSEASPAETYAADEFRRFFHEATGIDLPIRTEARRPGRHVYIGPGVAPRRSLPRFDPANMGPEEFRIRVGKKRIAIAGGRPRGTLYGVYQFLEDYLGVRFLTADHTYIPRDPSRLIPKGKSHRAPPFSFRWSFYRELAADRAFAARLRNNTVTRTKKLGGTARQPLITHSIHYQVPVGKYGADYPEYFTLVDGERLLEVERGGPQVCSTDPDVVNIVTRAVLLEIEAHPNRTTISVSPNDNGLYCTCRRCAAVDEREGSHMGAHLTLVNAVAARVEELYPNVKIGTLAYRYTRKPPRCLRPRHNVQIQLCSFKACTLHAINDPGCPRNAAFCEDLDGWLALTGDLWIWHYATNLRYLDLPFPNLRSIGPSLRYFRDRGARGVFVQANGRCLSGELSDVSNYVISRLLWNPDLDADTLIDEFLQLHYGPAAPPLREYIDLVHDNAEASGVHPSCYVLPEEVGLNESISRRALALFDQALTLAPDDRIQSRVEKAAICAYKALIETGGALVFDKGTLRMAYPPDVQSRIPSYETLCRRFGMTRNAEFTSAEDYFNAIKNNQAGVAALRLENELWRVTLVPDMNGLVVDMFHKPSGRNLLPAYGSAGINVPRGVFREWGSRGYDHQSPAAFEYELDDTSVVLTKTLADGSTVERTIALLPEQPGTIVCATTFIHRGEEPRTYQFSVLPELNASPVPENSDFLRGFVLNDTWTGFQAQETLDDASVALLKAATGGAIAFFNHHAGFGVQVSYQPGQFTHPDLAWNPTLQQIDLDVPTKPITLRQGGAFMFRYQFKFLENPPR